MSPEQPDWNRSPDFERQISEQQIRAAQELRTASERQRLAEQQLYPTIPTPLLRQSFEAWRKQALQQQAYAQPWPPPTTPLTEGTTPTKINPLGMEGRPNPIMAEIERLEKNASLQKEGPSDASEALTEKARQGLGKALNEAVAAGYLTEERAVAMIVAGGLNDQPMTAEGAMEQVVAALAQAVRSGAIDRASADSALARLNLPRLTGAPEGESLQSRDDLIYDALILRPCHRSEHAQRHQTTVWVCDEQAALAWGTMLEGLEIGAELLPRAAHMLNGARALCCQRDGNVGTWLRWGTTGAPPEPEETPA